MTSMSTSSIANSVPSLEEDGSNWYIFQQMFKAAIEYKGVWGHFDGMSKHPADATPTSVVEGAGSPKAGTEGVPTVPDPKGKGKSSSTNLEEWDKNNKLANYLLLTKMPDSVKAKYIHHKGVTKKWKSIVKEFTSKSMMMQSNLHSEFMAMPYKKGDLQKELDRVRMKYAMLINVGVIISKNDYQIGRAHV